MAAKDKIYREDDYLANSDLADQLREAVSHLIEEMKTSIPINKSLVGLGFGVSKTKRSIAADSVISITRAIKSLKGW